MILLLLACSLGGAPAMEDYGQVPSFSLQDQSGATVTRETYLGKVLVVDFMFTSCPDICPTLTRHMAEIQRHYAAEPDIHFLSISVDPATDTPPVLTAYAATHGADLAHWSFLTGPSDTVRTVVVDGFKQVMQKSGEEGSPGSILHGSRFIVVDRGGTLRAFPDPYEAGKTSMYAAIDAALAAK